MEKKALWVVFRPKDPVSLKKMRDLYMGSYPHFKEMTSLYAKTWWVNEEKNEWGAMYIFNSQTQLDAYIQSDRWQRIIPEKYGCTPETTVLDIGAILFKEKVTSGEDSWLTKDSTELN
ncbi:MAG: YdhR family protein [Deltaproteobacteria bacterium]|uniref:YdhR family protein n=1 Tax=Desulfobacula sp. TaxID=2593537 RepID=UPI001986199A|nr:YdhR family protein [Candidatus Desulfobacula maris]MBL6993370.1 YdhR family protein [Desulfobacula sp.]